MKLIEFFLFDFMLFLSLLNISYAEDHQQVIELTNDDVEHMYNVTGWGTSYYHVKAITNPFFAIGSTCIKVCMKVGDFDMDIYESMDEINNASPYWYDVIKTLHSWSMFFSTSKNKNNCREISGLSPYKEKYFFIKQHEMHANDQVLITIKHRVIDLQCCICLFMGLMLFTMASRLSKSVTFYYTSSTALGILASALVVVFILSRFLPRKPFAYSFVAGGWSLCAYIFSKLWRNLAQILLSYYLYFLIYICTTGFLTFAYCYHHGPISNPRTHSVIQWSVELTSLFLIYFGTQLPKVSVAIIVAVVLHRLFSSSYLNLRERSLFGYLHKLPLLNVYMRAREKPRKLLTVDEFHQQGQIETEKALEELRKYCNSPQCSPWKTLASIESPRRFAKFIEGEDHLSRQELTLYEEDMAELTDDSESVEPNVFLTSDDDSIDVCPLDNGHPKSPPADGPEK